MRLRRQKGRPLNGSADIYLNVSDKHPYKERLVEILDEIEDQELLVMELQDSAEGCTIEESRKRVQLANDLRLKVNRLTEEYEEITKALPLDSFRD